MGTLRAGTAFPESIREEVVEVETHLHSYERWFGAAAVPNGEVHVADRIGASIVAFRADAGNTVWGSWLQVLGSSDTPADTGKVYYDLHRVVIDTTERAQTTFIQLAFGASGAAALAAGTYTEFVFVPGTPVSIPSPLLTQMERAAVGTKAWVRVMVPGQDTGTVDLWVGLHEYDE